MDENSKQSKRQRITYSSLNVFIECLNVAEKASSITPAKAVFSTVSAILTMIRDSMINQEDYVGLGLACNTVCTALDRGLKGKRFDELNDSMRDAISQLRTTVEGIQSNVVKRSKKRGLSRAFHAKTDSLTIVNWRADLDRILLIFNTELGLNIYENIYEAHDSLIKTHVTLTDAHGMLSDIHREIIGNHEGADDRGLSTENRVSGESPPRAPRVCFGRDELIDEAINLAKDVVPIALIGPGGIGKTSIALTVLHHPRIKQRFGDNRRFIRCDQFPPSRAHLLSRLSKAIGAGIENPKDLESLRPFLSSGEMIIVLDNVESILDPSEGENAKEIYDVVEELIQFDNVCLCITSRISTIPPGCTTFDVPILSPGAARDTFYGIYKNAERPNLVDKILGQLDFHPLSITLLATVAHQNKWGMSRLTREWERQRTNVLQTVHNKSLAATIELSLASPMFQKLGPDAQKLLEVVAFFPQGIDENNLDWLFPPASNWSSILDKFSVLSLTYRSNSFITMLAPLRDHFRPEDPLSSSLLCRTKDQYFTRMSVEVDPNDPGFGETRWIMSEDVNIEHLLDIFTTINADSDDIWDVCANFIKHLTWHKKRLTILGPKIEGLPDGHRSKPNCLFELSRLLYLVGNHVERKRLLTHALKLERKWGNDHAIARILRQLSGASRDIGRREEGIRLAREASKIFERLGDTVGQGECLMTLGSLLESAKQLDAAAQATSHAIDLLSDKGKQHLVCESHRTLAYIYRSKGKVEEAIHQFGEALRIASSLNLDDQSFWVHHGLAQLFLTACRFDDAQGYIEHAKAYTSNSTYSLGCVMELQAELWYRKDKLVEAMSEALRAADVFENLGAAEDLRTCRRLLQWIEEEIDNSAIHIPGGLDDDREFG